MAVPGPPVASQWGRRPAPFVRDIQAGQLPPFPLPEFSFSVGEAPAQLEGALWGRGLPELDVLGQGQGGLGDAPSPR